MSITTLKKLLRVIIYLSFITPLLAFTTYFTFPFVVTKVLFFRTLMICSGSLLVLIWYYEGRIAKTRKRITPLMIVFGLYLMVLILSTIFAYDWRFSLWNNQERMLGLFTIFHYFILFFSARVVFAQEEWKKVFFLFNSVAVLVTMVGVIQKFLPSFFHNQGSSQVVATLGNPLYLAGLGIFLFFSAVFLFIITEGKVRWVHLIYSFFGIIAVFIAGNRGPFIGLVFGVFAGLLLYWLLLCKKISTKINTYLVLAIICIVVTGISLFIFRQSSFVQHIPIVGRVVNISSSSGTAQTRLMAWQVAWEGFKDKPALGWGLNNYYYVFNAHYNPDFLKFGFQETWFDNAHNGFFNVLAELGIIGFVSYLSIFFVLVYMLVRLYQKKHEHIHVCVFGISFLIAHLFYIFFVFENLTSYLYIFLFFAFVDVMWRDTMIDIVKKNKSSVRIAPSVIFTTAIIAFVLILITNVNVAKANNLGYQMRGLTVVAQKIEEGLSKFEETKKWHSPYQSDINWDYASSMLNVLPDVYEANATTARRIYDAGLQGIEAYITEHPYDVRARLVYSDVLRGGLLLFDLPFDKKINEQFVIAHTLSPQRQQIDYSELSFLAGTGNIKEAIERMKILVEQYPYSAEGYYNLARFYLADRQYLEVLPVLDLAVKKGIHFEDPTHLEFVAMAYERDGRFRDALYWWDQMYRVTGSENVKHKRDELSQLTKKSVPQSLEEFFDFDIEEVLDDVVITSTLNTNL